MRRLTATERKKQSLERGVDGWLCDAAAILFFFGAQLRMYLHSSGGLCGQLLFKRRREGLAGAVTAAPAVWNVSSCG